MVACSLRSEAAVTWTVSQRKVLSLVLESKPSASRTRSEAGSLYLYIVLVEPPEAPVQQL